MVTNAIIILGDNMIGSRSRHSSHRSAHSRHMSAHHRHTSSHGSALSRHRSATSRRHGISDAHAFAVGRATGVNINGSHMGAAGAAQHHGIKSSNRHRHRLSSSTSSYNHSTHGTGTKYNTVSNPNSTKAVLGIVGGIFTLFAIMSIVIFILIAVGFIYFILPYIK